MTSSEYKKIIDSFDVENNEKYRPGTSTYCNIFAQDVMDDCDAPLPSGTCSTMLDSMYGNKFPSWYSVNYTDAQARANDGNPTIAITSDHVAVVRPNDGSTPASVGKVRITQAGATCYADTTLSWGWAASRHDEVKFYSWY